MRIHSVLCLALIAASFIAISAQSPPPAGPVTSIPLLPDGVSLTSYSGYVNVNPQYNSNLFYWLFEAQNGESSSAPLLVWLNGGPGSSSMYGLFSENGPFGLSPDGSTLVMRNTSWNMNYNVMYIDNPVGTGLSFTDNDNGFVTDQTEVGQQLLTLLYQVYESYPQFQSVPLYICGESYAGKYVPAFAYAVHESNAAFNKYADAHPAELKKHQAHWKKGKHSPRSVAPFNVPHAISIPLAGISIGDGMMDPLTQIPGYGDYLFGLSMIDQSQREYMSGVEQQIVDLINQQQYVEAFNLFDPLMMSDIYPYPSYFNNVTGITDYFNFAAPSYPNNDFTTYLNRADVKAALHIDPAYVYSSGNGTVEKYLLNDWMQSIKPWLVTLLDNYDVLIYNGQNDIILSAPQCQNFLNQLSWTNSSAWQNAPHSYWRVNPDDANPAGYVKQGGSLTYVVVRGAGHLLPQDQPDRAFGMITRFINQQPFN